MDKPIFVLKNLPEVVKGALFSRYSRTDKSLRRVLLDEFIKKPEMGFKEIVGFQANEGVEDSVAIQKAEEFYDRVLVGYGDDSVAELGGAHIACEDVSNIASKFLEDPRIGLSPLEKSTRYVWFNQKVGGRYRYYLEPSVMESFPDLYVETCDLLFDTYSRLVEPMTKFVMERFPQTSDITERAYKASVKAKACDVLRVFLPASTLTNVGIFGNGRAFEYLLLRMYANPLKEMRCIAEAMQQELNKAIPSFVKRANDNYGKEQQGFITSTNEEMEREVMGIMGGKDNSSQSEPVTLVDYDANALDKIVSFILYQSSSSPLAKINEKLSGMSDEDKKRLIAAYLEKRKNRRHKPWRTFEAADYTFDILANYGIYRDLQRHRILTQIRQLLTTDSGFDTPKELEEAGFSGVYKESMHAAKDAFEQISKKMPKEAQYIVPMGYRIRWLMKLNLREAFHLCELRTMQQGHPDYRKVCQIMYQKIRTVHPWAEMKFVDMKEYGLERVEAEKKLDKKIEEVEKKYG
jgi:thymidylate synthase ThyX